jgi:hypothetical protein
MVHGSRLPGGHPGEKTAEEMARPQAVKVSLRDHEVFICCIGCQGELESDADKYLSELEKIKSDPAKYLAEHESGK